MRLLNLASENKLIQQINSLNKLILNSAQGVTQNKTIINFIISRNAKANNKV